MAKGYSLSEFYQFIQECEPWKFWAAVACMPCFLIFEGLSLLCIVREFGYPRRFSRGLVYASSDIYFSAITPSATGGQPICGYFMIRDGIPPATVTVALLLNLVMYSAAIVSMGVLALVIEPGIYARFETPSQVLIWIGYIALSCLAILFYLLLYREKLMHRICHGALFVLYKLHLIRDVMPLQRKLFHMMRDYSQCARLISGKWKLLLQVYVLNLLQRMVQICIPALLYWASGGSAIRSFRVWVLQIFVTIGSNCVPIPGAMGAADYLLLDGLGKMLGPETATYLELLSRGISFYSCVIVSGIIAFLGYLFSNKEGK